MEWDSPYGRELSEDFTQCYTLSLVIEADLSLKEGLSIKSYDRLLGLMP